MSFEVFLPAALCLQKPRSLCSNSMFELWRMGFVVLYLNCVIEDFQVKYLYSVILCGVCAKQVMFPNIGKMCRSRLGGFSTPEEEILVVLLHLHPRKRKTLSGYDIDLN